MKKLFFVITSIVFIVMMTIVYAGEKGMSMTDKQALFEAKCSACHNLDKVKDSHMTKEDVKQCLVRMSKKTPDMLKKEDFVNIEDYLSAYLVAERYRDLFVSRCTQCHSLECVQTAMDAGKIEGVAKKMAQKPGAGISEQEAQNSEDYLMNYIKREKVDIHHAAFESTCSSCHSLDKIKTAHVDKSKAKDIVMKMARKPKAHINPEDFDSYEEYLMKYITK